MKWTYFKDEEVEGLEFELVAMLDRARHFAGSPFIITSGKRTSDSNSAAGGVESSAHLEGLAVDLSVDNSYHRFEMINGLLKAGFKRIGVYDRHIHVDIDMSKPKPVIWTGVSK